MENHAQLERATGFWRLYATRQRGWVALACLVLCVFVRGFFGLPTFAYRDDSPYDVLDLQFAFSADKFRMVLSSWESIETFKRSVWLVDFVFPLVYAALLAFGYAWSRRAARPNRLAHLFFLAPFAAALCDWGENGLHLYLLRDVQSSADVAAAHYPGALVFTASTLAAVKFFLAFLVALTTLGILVINVWRHRKHVVAFLPYAYLLRFPLLAALGLVGLAYVAFFTTARSLLVGLFDLNAAGVFWVTLVAFLTAWTVMATWRLILLYGDRRFKVVPSGVCPTFGWDYLVRHGLLALPVVAGAVWMSPSSVWKRCVGALLGLAASLVALWIATWLQKFFPRPKAGKPLVDLLLPSPLPVGRVLDWASKQDPLRRLSNWVAAKLESTPDVPGPGLH